MKWPTFEGAKKSAEAHETVLGPNGLLRKLPYDQDDPKSPYVGLARQTYVRLLVWLVCSAVVVAITAATARGWSLIAIPIGAFLTLADVFWSQRDLRGRLSHITPAADGARIEDPGWTTRRTVRGLYSEAWLLTILSVLFVGQSPWLAAAAAGMFVPSVFAAWHVHRTITRTEEATGVVLALGAPRRRHDIDLRRPFYAILETPQP